MSRATDGASVGSIIFPELTFTQPGVYTYYMQETTPSSDGWITDDKVIPVIITVTRNEQGELTATAEYPNGAPEFVNIFCDNSAIACITAYYCAPGTGCRCTETSSFGVFDRYGHLISQAESSGGWIEFPCIAFSDPGVYEFSVNKLGPCGGAGYRVTVTVTRDADGCLRAEVTYPGGKPCFSDNGRRV